MSYSVLRTELKHAKDAVFSIWERNEPGVLHGKYAWMYENNPAGAAHVWLVRDDKSGMNVGCTALFIRRFVMNGKSLVGGMVGDLLIDKAHRCAGAALMLQRQVLTATQDGTVDFIYGFPNKGSEPIFKRIGYRLLGERARYVAVTKTAPYFSGLLGGRYWGSMAAFPLDWARRSFWWPNYHSDDNSFTCQEVEGFDDRFDSLWKEKRISGQIVGERNLEYLRWKFIRAPHCKNKVLALFDVEKQYAKGFIVYRYVGQSVEVRDFLCCSDPRVMANLIRKLVGNVALPGVSSIWLAALKNSQLKLILGNSGFVERKDPHRIYLFCSEKVEKAIPSINDAESWLLLQSDDDM